MQAQAEAGSGAGAARIEPPAAAAAAPPAPAPFAPAPPATQALPAAPAVATPVTSMAAEARAERVAETLAIAESPAGQNRLAAADAAVAPPAAAAPARPALRDSAKMASAQAPAAPEAGVRQPAGAAGALARATLDIASPDGRERWRVRGTNIEHSLDAGTTWSTTASLPAIAVTVGASPARGVCWLAGRDGVVLRTTDGVRWVRVPSPIVADVVNLDARDARTATIVTRDGRRFSTADGGATWVSP
ncbi:MAG: hypothetical protein JNM38_05255 [Acidobacteria bacterium]|nr:hypothetical protein [Acidobacteriota bacterium]